MDFKGFVDFFLLQDCVTADYGEVKILGSWSGFNEDPLPKDVDGYLDWVDWQLEFVRKRNERISSLQ